MPNPPVDSYGCTVVENRDGRMRTKTYTIVPYSRPRFPYFFGIIPLPFCDGFARIRQRSATLPYLMAECGRTFRHLPHAPEKFRRNAATNLIFPEIADGGLPAPRFGAAIHRLSAGVQPRGNPVILAIIGCAPGKVVCPSGKSSPGKFIAGCSGRPVPRPDEGRPGHKESACS